MDSDSENESADTVNEYNAQECCICKLSFSLLDLHKEIVHKAYPENRCFLCGLLFGLRREFLAHTWGHRDERTFCHWCQASFDFSEDLLFHLDVHREAHVYFCDICKRTFATKESLSRHCSSHDDYICLKCQQSFPNAGVLRSHYKQHRKSNGCIDLTCQFCKKTFSSRDHYKAHINSHLGIRQYVCDQCEETFVSQKRLSNHFRIVHDLRTNQKCEICGIEFSSTRSYQGHLKSHGLEPYFECNWCSRKFKYKNGIKVHVQEVTCEICSDHFFCNDLYQEHISLHPAVCQYCHKMYDKQSVLKRHITVKHSDVKNVSNKFKCELCQFATTTSRNFMRHNRRQHSLYTMKKETLEKKRNTLKQLRLVFKS